MASIPISTRIEAHPSLRPLNILRDLPAVADLIELCFSNTMDTEGQRYVQDMRRAGRDDGFLRWATKVAESTSLPLTGYVWEEDGRIVGNASLVPFRQNGRRIYLIANVAVHPDFRRHGIARALTGRALQHSRQHKVSAVWLHVRDDNPGAIQLYADLGFREHARRTSWQAGGLQAASKLPGDLTVTTRLPRYWPQQQDWLRRLYPDELAWYHSWNFSALRPGLWNWFYLAFVDINVRQWAAVQRGQLEATLAWIPAGRESNALWLAASPKSSPEAITAVLNEARRVLSYQPNVFLEYPAGEAVEAIQSAGFKPLRTLIWMEAPGATSPA